ncbi:MAG TPA: DUF3551 domain-containing protein [Bradyrhizobium sp.]|nr:DUF3551 domain-containing protein [Bradyrhizobium sp.]
MMHGVALVAVALAAMAASLPARAQTYDPNFPVCLRVYGLSTYNDCRYTSLAQCQLSASGRAAQCMVNPFAANAQVEPSARYHKRIRREY